MKAALQLRPVGPPRSPASSGSKTPGRRVQQKLAPGSFRPARDLWGAFPTLLPRLEGPWVGLVDRRVAKLHPLLRHALEQSSPQGLLQLPAGEPSKSFPALSQLLSAGAGLPRSGTLLCIGGGTLGDLGTVAAHLLKRGVKLIHVPTTLLAAVDSSLGGKGAVHVDGVKNAAGVFHYPQECWICPELFETLSDSQRREGRIEAAKMAVCLNPSVWRRLPTEDEALVRAARRMKALVCQGDPYEQSGLRAVLNFGHTFGHAMEALTHFRVSHGEAVGLGMLCALDVGRSLGVTPAKLAESVEAKLISEVGVGNRLQLAKALHSATPASLRQLLSADKKTGSSGKLRMVLLTQVGKTVLSDVSEEAWKVLLPAWRQGRRP